jgi:hypothetical protein
MHRLCSDRYINRALKSVLRFVGRVFIFDEYGDRSNDPLLFQNQEILLLSPNSQIQSPLQSECSCNPN